MSKSSTATTREAPLQKVADASAGGLVVRGETFTVETTERADVIDLTDRLREIISRSGVREGVVNVWALHTTCALFINEYQTALLSDIKRVLEHLVSRDEAWMHNDPAYSDCDRMNADSHLRAMLLGHSLTLQVTGGEVALGQWQRTLLAEMDGPRTRTLRVQILGV